MKVKFLLCIFVIGMIYSNVIIQSAMMTDKDKPSNILSEEAEPKTSAEQYEPNDSYDTAVEINVGTYTGLTVQAGDTSDYYKVYCSKSGGLVITVDSDDYNNLVVELRNIGGRPGPAYNLIMWDAEEEPRKVYVTAPINTYYIVGVLSSDANLHTYDMTISITSVGGNTYITEEADDDDDNDSVITDQTVLIGTVLVIGSLGLASVSTVISGLLFRKMRIR